MSLLLPAVAWSLSFALTGRLLEATQLGLNLGQLRLCIVLSSGLFAYQQSSSIVQGLGDDAVLRNGRIVQGVLFTAGVSLAPVLLDPSPVNMFVLWAAAYAGGTAFLLVNVWRVACFGVDLGRLMGSIRYGARATWTQISEFVNLRGDQLLVASIAAPAVLGVDATTVSLSEVRTCAQRNIASGFCRHSGWATR